MALCKCLICMSQMQLSSFSLPKEIVQKSYVIFLCENSLFLSHTLTQRRCIFFSFVKEGRKVVWWFSNNRLAECRGWILKGMFRHTYMSLSFSLSHTPQLEMCGFYLAEILQKEMKQDDNSKLLPPGLESSI